MIGAIFRKELRELRRAGGMLLGVAVGIAAVASQNSDAGMMLLFLLGISGVLLGMVQGELDRRSRRDEFVLHRPVPRGLTHAGRSAAGLTWALLIGVLPGLLVLLLPYHERSQPFAWHVDVSGPLTLRGSSVAAASLAAGLCVMGWATARLGASSRNAVLAMTLALVLPSLGGLVVLRQSGDAGVGCALVLVTLVAMTASFLELARPRNGVLRNAFVGVLLVVATLETALWIRPMAHVIQPELYPRMAVSETYELVLHEYLDHPKPKGVTWVRVYDVDRNEIAYGRMNAKESVLPPIAARVSVTQEPFEHSPYSTFDGDLEHGIERRLFPRSWTQSLAWALTSADPRRSQHSVDLEWNVEDGRLVARRRMDRELVEVLGPEGAFAGDARDRAGRWDFETVHVVTNTSIRGWIRLDDEGRVALVDPGRRRVTFIQLVAPEPETPKKDEAPEEDEQPKKDIEIVAPLATVTHVDLPGTGPISALPAIGWRGWVGARHDRLRERDVSVPLPVRVGDDVFAIDATDGVVGTVSIPVDRGELTGSHDGLGFTSMDSPARAVGVHMQFHLVDEDGVDRTVTIDLDPVRWQEWIGAALVTLPTVLRPPLLNVVSAAAPPPPNRRAMFHRWWLDAVIAGGGGLGALAVSLLLAVVSAWRCRRRARLLCGKGRPVFVWTVWGAMLGPIALLWQRAALPTTHVEACTCGERRSVTVDVCDGCGAGWPTPGATGCEVFA